MKTSEVKAIKEVRSDLNILKQQCGSKVKEYALERVRKITPEADLEVGSSMHVDCRVSRRRT